MLDLIAGAPDEKLLEALITFTNVLLSDKLSTIIREVIFGERLITLQKNYGGIRLIVVSYNLHRLAAKCANPHIIERRNNELSLIQVGVRVSGGAERQSSRKSAGYQDQRTQKGYRMAVFISRSRHTLLLCNYVML